jgi:hypothetical protein
MDCQDSLKGKDSQELTARKGHSQKKFSIPQQFFSAENLEEKAILSFLTVLNR